MCCRMHLSTLQLRSLQQWLVQVPDYLRTELEPSVRGALAVLCFLSLHRLRDQAHLRQMFRHLLQSIVVLGRRWTSTCTPVRSWSVYKHYHFGSIGKTVSFGHHFAHQPGSSYWVALAESYQTPSLSTPPPSALTINEGILSYLIQRID